MKLVKISLVAAALLCAAPLAATAPLDMGKTIPTPEEPRAIPLYQGAAPGYERATQKLVWTQWEKQRWERNITAPSIIPILPPADKANGAAMLVVPSGGFLFLSMDNEGYNIAKLLNEKGIAAFILQYRTLATPEPQAEYGAFMMKLFDPKLKPQDRMDVSAAIPVAMADAQVALKYIKAHAADYHIDSERLGMIGFSAGAMTTFATVMADDPKARPAYVGVIYGPTSMDAAGKDAKVPADAPPMFNALSKDDRFFGTQSLSAIEAWRAAGKGIEFHMYEGGGHGWATSPTGHSSDIWFDEFIAWMKANKWLDRK
jgi:acetyl esterase/lipase